MKTTRHPYPSLAQVYIHQPRGEPRPTGLNWRDQCLPEDTATHVE